MASNWGYPIKQVEVKLINIAKHRAIGSGVKKLIESNVIIRRRLMFRPLNKTELNPLYDADSDNSVEQISGSEEPVSPDNSETRTKSNAPVSLDNPETRTGSNAPVSLDNPETRLGSAKYDDTYSSCSDSEIMEIFQRSNEERKKRRKVWEERKKIKKRKYEEIQISDSESDCEVLAKSNLSISPPCSNSSRRSSSSLQVLEDRVSASKPNERSSSLQVLEDRVSASKPDEQSSSPQVLEDRVLASKSEQQDCLNLMSRKFSNLPVNRKHRSQPSSSSQTNSKQMMFTKKNLDHTFDTDTGDEEEFQRKEFERNSAFKLKKLRIDIKEEHPFLRSMKPSRVHLKSSRANIRRLFYTQKKNLDEPIVFRSLFSLGLVCPHCDLRLETNESLKFAEHVQYCKYLSTHDTIDDDVLIMSHEIDVDVRIEEVEIPEETRTCPKCNEEVPISMVDSHAWFHRPYPCSVCFHRYIKKTDTEDHIINDHATHFMSNLIPFWRSEEALKVGPGLPQVPVPPTSNPGIPQGAVQALIREADGSSKTIYIAQIPPGTILPGNPTQIVINNHNYQILNTVGGHQSLGTPMPCMPLPQQPLPRENLIRGSSNHRLPLNTPQQYIQPRNHQPLPRPSFSPRNCILPKSRPVLPWRFPTGAATQFRPRSFNPMIRSRRPTMFIPSMQGMKLDEDGAPIQESDPLSFDETQQEDPLAI
ncbi:uncharacterized protein LOC111694998 isoform X2 [Eurytemora carolleeae]|uniref:uncharacterized protein LOC111694998 isoform X2 n=1 Tax=Eurytemora carolleeae TaxID=1294199 RepID=UPI000C76EED4|nr:uncharacterized protein LOC111694998 isoform X2 [Eurytemora carolleeae]|eukprot:XP_023319893.1 uncharacterized protein LOC111694998 isoform X2 [Eurytemora affinis]